MEIKSVNKEKKHIVHPFEPIINVESRTLILGSLPSVKSREDGFYYGNKQNRFWNVLKKIFSEYTEVSEFYSIENKKSFLEINNIALYDAIYECDIYGSSDESIENVTPTNIEKLINNTSVGIIYCNGVAAYKIVMKYNKQINVPVICLPSTSPANAAWNFNALVNAWRRIAIYCNRTDFDKSYLSLNSYANTLYKAKLYKIPIDGGFTCPNRDGSIGFGGCIFCDSEGSGHFTGNRPLDNEDNKKLRKVLSVKNQIKNSKQLISAKLPQNKKIYYIAYFQSFTGTYAPVQYLRELYNEAISDPDVGVLSIATRPDCLDKEVLELLNEISQKIDVWIELGLQSSKDDTRVLINRGYENKIYEKAVVNLHKNGIKHVITHVILGLPGENVEDMIATVEYACQKGTDGIKLQLLHVLKGTVLAQMYENKEFDVISIEDYAMILKKCIEVIPPDIVIHRLTGDGDKNKLIAPIWSADKKRVLNYINKYLE